MGILFQILGYCSHCSVNIDMGEIRVVAVWISPPPRRSFIGKPLDNNWVGFVDKAFDQKNNLSVTVNTYRDGTHKETLEGSFDMT